MHQNSERGFDDSEEPRGTFATYAEAKAFAKRDFFKEYPRDQLEAFRMHHGGDEGENGSDDDDDDDDGDDDDDSADKDEAEEVYEVDEFSNFGSDWSGKSDGNGEFRIRAVAGEGEVVRVCIETITGPALLPAPTPTASTSKQLKTVYLIFAEEKLPANRTGSHKLQQDTAYDTVAEANKEARKIFVDKVPKTKAKRRPTPKEKNIDSATALYSGEIKGVPEPNDTLRIFVKKVAVQYASADSGKKRTARENGSSALTSTAAGGSRGGTKRARKSR